MDEKLSGYITMKLVELATDVAERPSLRSWERLRAMFTALCILADVDGNDETIKTLIGLLREGALKEDASDTAKDAFDRYLLAYVDEEVK